MRRSLRMASAVENTIQQACDTVNCLDQEMARCLIEGDEEIDREEVAIENEALRLMTLFQPMGVTMRRLCTILKVNSDLERKLAELLNQPVSWSASHIQTGRKWSEIASDVEATGETETE